MEHLETQPVAASVPETCLAAGAVVRVCDGRAVVAHYGSIPGEIAVCMKRVGLADRADHGVLELRGQRELLDRALAARCGDPPPAIGSARRRRGVWHLRLDARNGLLVGPHSALAREQAAGRGRDHHDLSCRDVGASLAIVGLAGPRAARLLAAAGLPGDLPLGAIGSSGDGDGVTILRESRRSYLALVRADAADRLWARLLAAGEPLGAAFVGLDALTLLNASPRPSA